MVKQRKEKMCMECGYSGAKRSYGGCGGCGGAIYGLGVVGAMVYFIGQATSFWAGFLGIFQAFFWPAFLVYEALKALIK